MFTQKDIQILLHSPFFMPRDATGATLPHASLRRFFQKASKKYPPEDSLIVPSLPFLPREKISVTFSLDRPPVYRKILLSVQPKEMDRFKEFQSQSRAHVSTSFCSALTRILLAQNCENE
jgi:hypothetical protein